MDLDWQGKDQTMTILRRQDDYLEDAKEWVKSH